jgi:hypothetical protein
LAANDSLNHSPDAHCNEYTAKQLCCFAAPQSGAAKSFLAFRHPIFIIKKPQETAESALASVVPSVRFF